MISYETIEKELKILEIDSSQRLTIRYVTQKYKEIARMVHPDKPGGDTGEFQEILQAYRNIIQLLENDTESKNKEHDYETQFFMKNNFMKVCTSSYVVYIQGKYAKHWRRVLERHLVAQKADDIRVIFKSNQITITLYECPKRDPRPKIHIQSSEMAKNLEFIMEKLTLFYREVCNLAENVLSSDLQSHDKMKCTCSVCGKILVNKKGLRSHMTRMHTNKTNINNTELVEINYVRNEKALSVASQKFMVVNPMLDIPKSPMHKKIRLEPKSNDVNSQKHNVVSEIVTDLIEMSTYATGMNGTQNHSTLIRGVFAPKQRI